MRKKKIRTRGKLQFSRYFQDFKVGDSVAIVRERATQPRFPERLQGKTGIVEGKRGKTYIIKVRDKNKEKKFLIAPIHLKKMKNM